MLCTAIVVIRGTSARRTEQVIHFDVTMLSILIYISIMLSIPPGGTPYDLVPVHLYLYYGLSRSIVCNYAIDNLYLELHLDFTSNPMTKSDATID
jgi:hypothetical protein